MNSNTSKKANLSLALGAALTAGLALSPASVQADSNPFATAELASGYMQLAKHHAEGKCGEGKCGGDMKKDREGKCGEGKCGAAEGKDAEGKFGGADKATEGKCGEGKCGGSN